MIAGLVAVLLAAGAWDRAAQAVRRLWEKPEPAVTEGNAFLAADDPDGALKKYEEARVPDNGVAAGALSHDKASALLHRGDAQTAPQAIEEANRALEHGDAKLKPLAAYDLAYALEQSGRPDEAAGAYARALQLDPGDEDAKVNLELLLREEERKKKQPNAQGKPDEQKKQRQAGDDQRKEPQNGKEQRKNDPEKQAGDRQQTRSDEQKQDQPQQAREQPKPGDKKQQEQLAARPMDRSDAQRLLDALRAGEKNLQVWRFGQQKTKERRPDVEKDW
jgi:Ca-activated chloride channel homolog